MSEFMSHYLVPAAVIAVAIVLLLGLVNMMRGGSPNRSQKLMRLRVLLQFVAIIIILATIWVMVRQARKALRSLHRSCAHILFFLLRLFRLFLLGRGIIGCRGFGGMTLTSASLSRRGGQCQKCGGNSNRQNTHERHP